jgi:endonuclease III
MDIHQKASIILDKLESHYKTIKCGLDFSNAYELLIATILSAQCTDKRVNIVTPKLFEKYPTPKDLAYANIEEVKEIIRSTGFFNNKAKSIIGASKGIVENFNEVVPDNMEDLITLPGVARKTANVVLGVAYKKPVGIAVDTHVKRLSKLLGLTVNDDPVKIEKDLMKLFPQSKWDYISLALIEYGREFCSAKKHDYNKCFLGGHD